MNIVPRSCWNIKIVSKYLLFLIKYIKFFLLVAPIFFCRFDHFRFNHNIHLKTPNKK